MPGARLLKRALAAVTLNVTVSVAQATESLFKTGRKQSEVLALKRVNRQNMKS
jgi:hypothetical protein